VINERRRIAMSIGRIASIGDERGRNKVISWFSIEGRGNYRGGKGERPSPYPQRSLSGKN